MTDHNSYTTSVTFADQIELNEQPMLESQPRSTTTTNAETITARDVFNCILTTNVKRAVLLLVPTLCVIYIWCVAWRVVYTVDFRYSFSRRALVYTPKPASKRS